jgi:predicted transcriptional regulator
MKTQSIRPFSASEIFHAISDKKSLMLFNLLGTEGGKSEVLITKLEISRKEYYSRMSRLVDLSIVKRLDGEYNLTIFGRLIYEAQLMLSKTVDSVGGST